jgi:hypothetical protein
MYMDLKHDIFEVSKQQIIPSKRQVVSLITFSDLRMLMFLIITVVLLG